MARRRRARGILGTGRELRLVRIAGSKKANQGTMAANDQIANGILEASKNPRVVQMAKSRINRQRNIRSVGRKAATGV